MNYKQAMEYIHDAGWNRSMLGTERIKALLEQLGNPQDSMKYIHIAGTNGKGSTAAMLSSVLKQCGYKTGLYTSPYIFRFNERIQINNRMITNSDIARLTDIVRQKADMIYSHPTQFELITALAFLFFQEKQCDIVVLEVGMGGEFDATNVISASELDIITAIGMDHVKELGPEIQDIASAKAGIIKKEDTVISYGHNPEADLVIQNRCSVMKAELICPDFDKIHVQGYDTSGQIVSYGDIRNIVLPLLGSYQKYNLAVVLEAVYALRKKGYTIRDRDVKKGIRLTSWPARFEIVSDEPFFIVDGGHNPHGVDGTVSSLKTLFPGKKFIFILGVMADKDYPTMLNSILPLAEFCYTVRPDNERALDPFQFCEEIRKRGVMAEACSTVHDGVLNALANAGKDGIVCAMGSLYMSGEVIKEYKKIRRNP